MRIRIFAVLAMMALASVAIPQRSNAAPITVKQVAESIRGRVMTQAGEPITEALVSLMAAGRPDAVVTVRTEADGSYELPAPSNAGAYSVRVLRIGYTPVNAALVQQNGVWKAPATIAMQPITMLPGFDLETAGR